MPGATNTVEGRCILAATVVDILVVYTGHDDDDGDDHDSEGDEGYM